MPPLKRVLVVRSRNTYASCVATAELDALPFMGLSSYQGCPGRQIAIYLACHTSVAGPKYDAIAMGAATSIAGQTASVPPHLAVWTASRLVVGFSLLCFHHGPPGADFVYLGRPIQARKTPNS